MAATADSVRAASSTAAVKATLVVLGGFVVFFVLTDVLKYFFWSEDTYGYYWQFRVPLLLHVVGGLAALLSGLFQLWSGAFRQSMRVHPWTGRVYVGAIALGAIGALILSVTSAVYGFAWSIGLITLAAAWLATTGVAVHCIRRRDVRAHQQWMIRSYIVTFGFVTFRIFVDYLPYEQLWGIQRAEMANALIWAAWVVPLLIYQIYLQYKNA